MTDDQSFQPYLRPRRLRRGQVMRDLVADVTLGAHDLVLPMFVRQGQGLHKPVLSMPGVAQMSPDRAVEQIEELANQGLRSFILFGVTEPDAKDAVGSAALDADNPVNLTLKHVRDAGVDVVMMADLCLCEYTDHGHCGALTSPASKGGVGGGIGKTNAHQTSRHDPHSESPSQPPPSRGRGCDVDNDATLELLGQQAILLAESGADVVAPSGMMDGMVGAIRAALDATGHDHTTILSYSVKYASAMYGPFREAGEGTPQFGDRRGYQMDYRRQREWRTELELDIAEGADMVMVKPAAAYLDIIRQVRDATDLPVAAYHVSGEYSMIHAAAANGWIDLQAAAVEVTTAIKRAGADLILTYFAGDLLKWMRV